MIFSKINYAIELYGRKNNQWFRQLQKSTNRILKILFNKHKRHSIDTLHRELQLLKIQDQANLRLSLLVHRDIHAPTQQPDIIHKSFMILQKNKTRILRNTRDLFVTAQSFSYINKIIDSASMAWNNINIDLKCIENREVFRSELTNHYMAKYVIHS